MHHRSWKCYFIFCIFFSCLFGQFRNLWSTWIGKIEHACDFIESFTNSIIDCTTQYFIFIILFNVYPFRYWQYHARPSECHASSVPSIESNVPLLKLPSFLHKAGCKGGVGIPQFSPHRRSKSKEQFGE